MFNRGLSFVFIFSFLFVSFAASKQPAISDAIRKIESAYPFEINQELAFKKAIQGYLTSLDPYSELISPEDRVEDKNAYGIGVEVELAQDPNRILISYTFPGTPAAQSGLKKGDEILLIDKLSVEQKSLSQVRNMIVGQEGSKVTFKIRRGEGTSLVFEVERKKIHYTSIEHQKIQDGILYMRILNFNSDTPSEMRKAVDQALAESKLYGILIDLRDNSGGFINEAIGVAQLFLDKKLIMKISKTLKKKTEQEVRTKTAPYKDVPVMIMINEKTASSSEMLAAAFQDNQRGIIYGKNSVGKTRIQSILPLLKNYEVKLTVGQFLTPKGRDLTGIGLSPDIKSSTIKENELTEALAIFNQKIKN